MKLPVKQKYFKQLKNGKKLVDYRDAHITFVNEGETGGKIIRKVIGVSLMSRSMLPDDLRNSIMFGDDTVICFELEPEKK